MRWKAIVLDFDGVLIESVGAKDAAFRALYASYPEHLPAIMAYHVAHNATIRFDKFRYIAEHILRIPCSETDVAALGRQFSSFIVDRLIQCPWVDGAQAFVGEYQARVPLYLASVSPAEELARVLEARGLAGSFRRVYAYPWKKVDAIADVLRREAIEPADLAFVGDTREDYLAAASKNIAFVGRDSGRPFGDTSAPVCRDMHEVAGILKQPALQPVRPL